MKTPLLLVALVVTLSQAQVSDAEIEKAILAGQNRKFKDLVSECIATRGFGEGFAAGMAGGIQPIGSYDVTVSTNIGRIAFLAADAKRLYKPFTLASVTEELKNRSIFVFVNPHKPQASGNTYDVPAMIDSVVLKSKTDPGRVLQPVSFETQPVEWGNLLGGKVSGNSAVAQFDYDAVRDLPKGDLDVVVITAPGERRCKVGQGDRGKLFR